MAKSEKNTANETTAEVTAENKKETADVFQTLGSKLNEWAPDYKGDVTKPLLTGFKSLDLQTGGINVGLTVLGAESGFGKSTFAFQIAEQVVRNTISDDDSAQDVIVFSLEMSARLVNATSISRYTFRNDIQNAISASDMMNPGKYKDELKKAEKAELINKAIDELTTINSHICFVDHIERKANDKRPDGAIILERVKKHVNEQNKNDKALTPLVIVDYLQILSAPEERTEKGVIDANVKALHELSKICPTIVISSLNRDSYNGRYLGLRALKGSGEIEYTADTVMMIKFTTDVETAQQIAEEKAKEPRKVSLMIEKQRFGATGIRIDFDYYPKYYTFVEANRPITSDTYNNKKKKAKQQIAVNKDNDEKIRIKNDMLFDEFLEEEAKEI